MSPFAQVKLMMAAKKFNAFEAVWRAIILLDQLN
jgi:hypothetical protein